MFHMLALGDLRIGRGRRDLQDAVLLIDLGGRHGDAGIEVADDELDAVGRRTCWRPTRPAWDRRRRRRRTTVIFWPRMPPAALMSSTACSAPFFSCAPKAAFGPVIGPATPILIWAVAVSGRSAIAKPSAKPSVVIFFIACSPSTESRQTRPVSVNATSGRFAAPAHRAVARSLSQRYCVTIWRDARRPKAEQSRKPGRPRIDQIIVQRQQGAVEQAEMDEAHGAAQDTTYRRRLPPRPPGRGDGAAGEPRRRRRPGRR